MTISLEGPPTPPLSPRCAHCGNPIESEHIARTCSYCFVTLHEGCTIEHNMKERHPDVPPFA